MRLPGPTVAALVAMVDQAVEQVRQHAFGSFIRLRGNPELCRAEAVAAEQVGQRFKALLRGLTDE